MEEEKQNNKKSRNSLISGVGVFVIFYTCVALFLNFILNSNVDGSTPLIFWIFILGPFLIWIYFLVKSKIKS